MAVNDNLFKASVSVLQKPVTSKSTCSANKLTDFCLTQKQPFADVFQNRSSRTAFSIEHFWWLLLLIGMFVLIELTHFNLMFHFHTPINLSSIMTWQRVIRMLSLVQINIHQIYSLCIRCCKPYTAKIAVILPNFLVWKFCGKAEFPHSFGPFARNYAETVPFHKFSTPGN